MSHLTEPGIRQLFIQNLNECKAAKMQYNTKMLNLSLFFGFVAVLSIILFVRFKGKISEEEKTRRNEEDRLHVLNQIKLVQMNRQKVSNHLITSLPLPDSPFFYRS